MHDDVDISELVVNMIGESITVDNPKFSNGVLKFDKQGTSITGIPEYLWNMGMGGYVPLQKWLKDRKGWVLSKDDIIWYCTIVMRLKKTYDIMQNLNEGEY